MMKSLLLQRLLQSSDQAAAMATPKLVTLKSSELAKYNETKAQVIERLE